MARWLSVSISAVYYKISYTSVNTFQAITIANRVCMFDAGRTGLCLGTSLVVGSNLAELVMARTLDLILYMDVKRHSGMRRVEVRLYLTLTALAMLAGLIVYRSCIQRKTHGVHHLRE